LAKLEYCQQEEDNIKTKAVPVPGWLTKAYVPLRFNHFGLK